MFHGLEGHGVPQMVGGSCLLASAFEQYGWCATVPRTQDSKEVSASWDREKYGHEDGPLHHLNAMNISRRGAWSGYGVWRAIIVTFRGYFFHEMRWMSVCCTVQ